MSEKAVSEIIGLCNHIIECARIWDASGVSRVRTITRATTEICNLVSGLSVNDPGFSLADIVERMPLPSRDSQARAAVLRSTIVTDADAQAFALLEVEREDYCRSYGLDLSTTWSQIRDWLREKSTQQD